ncbi:MAG: hypothetical protein ACRDMX_14665 [Solirubrobacteraceae bacterium]
MPRLADLGLRIRILPSAPTASILDVPGVGVGHATVWRDEPAPPEGRGVARTGVTVGGTPPPPEGAVAGRDGNTSHGLHVDRVRELMGGANA